MQNRPPMTADWMLVQRHASCPIEVLFPIFRFVEISLRNSFLDTLTQLKKRRPTIKTHISSCNDHELLTWSPLNPLQQRVSNRMASRSFFFLEIKKKGNADKDLQRRSNVYIISFLPDPMVWPGNVSILYRTCWKKKSRCHKMRAERLLGIKYNFETVPKRPNVIHLQKSHAYFNSRTCLYDWQ